MAWLNTPIPSLGDSGLVRDFTLAGLMGDGQFADLTPVSQLVFPPWYLASLFKAHPCLLPSLPNRGPPLPPSRPLLSRPLSSRPGGPRCQAGPRRLRPRSAAGPSATRPPPRPLPLQLLILFHRGGGFRDPQVLLADERLCPISRNVEGSRKEDTTDGRSRGRKEPRTEGGRRSRSGASKCIHWAGRGGSAWRPRPQTSPPARGGPRQGLSRSPGTPRANPLLS